MKTKLKNQSKPPLAAASSSAHGARVARYIFSRLDCGKDKCQRLAAKGGVYPDRETNLGGLCEAALAGMIDDALSEANDELT